MSFRAYIRVTDEDEATYGAIFTKGFWNGNGYWRPLAPYRKKRAEAEKDIVEALGKPDRRGEVTKIIEWR